MKNILTAWDFVEAHYPNYSDSQEIADNDALSKLVDKQVEDGSYAEILLKEITDEVVFENPLDDCEFDLAGKVIEAIQRRFDTSCAEIYKTAIQSFLDKQ